MQKKNVSSSEEKQKELTYKIMLLEKITLTEEGKLKCTECNAHECEHIKQYIQLAKDRKK
jgi:hypothetical protein